jgi:hypothetical protein
LWTQPATDGLSDLDKDDVGPHVDRGVWTVLHAVGPVELDLAVHPGGAELAARLERPGQEASN